MTNHRDAALFLVNTGGGPTVWTSEQVHTVQVVLYKERSTKMAAHRSISSSALGVHVLYRVGVQPSNSLRWIHGHHFDRDDAGHSAHRWILRECFADKNINKTITVYAKHVSYTTSYCNTKTQIVIQYNNYTTTTTERFMNLTHLIRWKFRLRRP